MKLKTGQTIWFVSIGINGIAQANKIFLDINETRDQWRAMIGKAAIYTSRRKALFGAALYNKMAANRAKQN